VFGEGEGRRGERAMSEQTGLRYKRRKERKGRDGLWIGMSICRDSYLPKTSQKQRGGGGASIEKSA
jgi:hypothetical protein